MYRFPVYLIALLVALCSPPDRGAAQVDTSSGTAGARVTSGTLRESALARARRAAEVRDSLLRIRPDLNVTTVDLTVRKFLQDPYGSTDTVTLAELDQALATANQQLVAIRKKEQGEGTEGEDGNGAPGAAPAATLLSGGATALPMIAVGAADYFVERAKDEVAFGFVITLRDRVRKDDLIEAAFPRSHALMQEMDTETFQSFMPHLRSRFIADFDELPTRSAPIAAALGLTGQERARAMSYLQSIAIIYARGREIRNGIPPAVALSNLVDVNSTQMTDAGTRRALRLVGLLAREYASGGGEPVIQDLTQRDRGWLRRYFVALVARDLLAIEETPAESALALLAFLSSRETDAILLLNQLHAVRDALRDVQGSTSQATGSQAAADPADRVLAAAGAVLNVLRTAPRFAYFPGDQVEGTVQSLDSTIAEATRLHQAVVQHDYGAIVGWLLQNPHFDFCGGTEERQCQARMRYLTLGSALATAQTSAEVTTALRTASTPVGSYRAKRSQDGRWFAPRSASLIGYLGAGRYDIARVEGQNGGGEVHAGVALPVGPEVSFGMPWGALSLFVPLVDLGPIANERLGFADGEENGEFGTDELLSPGLVLVFNLSRTLPLSIGAGVTSVRRDVADGENSRRVNVSRSLLFVGVDATLFQFRF